MLRETADRLIERDVWKRSCLDVVDEIIAIPQKRRTICRSRGETGKVIERLMVRDEVGAVFLSGVDDLPFRLWGLPPIGERKVPPTRIPRPTHTLRGQGVPDCFRILGRKWCASGLGALWIGQIGITLSLR